MPLIETTGIRPIDRRQMPGGPETIRRQDDGSGSAFRPQTNVSLKTAIQDMAATLGKISAEEKFGIQKLPQEVGDVVKNILRQSLSVEATLARGIGSTVESQRFSADQLMLFSRMLSQVGMLVEKGYSMELSDETQTLLSNLKSAVVSQEGGENFEPVLMSKASFELVDAKTAEQLPQALYEVLSQLAQMPAATQQQPQAQSDGMQFLKQLVKFFMPRPGVDVPAEEQPPPQQGQLPHQPPSATQRFLNSMFRNFGGRFSQPQAQAQASTSQPQAQTQSSTSQPQAQAQSSTSQPQTQTQLSTSQPQAQAQQSTGQPQAQAQSSTSQPQAQAQQSTGQPQAQAQSSTSQPQAQAQSSTSQPQTQTQSSTSQPQAQPQSSTGQPQAQPSTGQPQAQTQSSTGQPQAQPQPSTSQPQAQAQPSTSQPQAQPQSSTGQPQAQPSTSQPQTQTQSSTGQPQAQAQQSTGQPQAQAQSSTGQPQAQAQSSTGQPQAQAQPSTSQPQTQTQSSTSQPQAQAQPSTSQPQAQAQSSTGQPQAQTQSSTSQPQTQAQASTSQPQAQASTSQPQAQASTSQPQAQTQSSTGQPQAQTQSSTGQPQAQTQSSTGQPQAQASTSQPQAQSSTSQPQAQTQSSTSQPQAQAQPSTSQPQAQTQSSTGQPQAQPQSSTSQPQAQPSTSQPQAQPSTSQPQAQAQSLTSQPQAQAQSSTSQPQAQAQSSTPMPQNVSGEFIARQQEMREQMDVAKTTLLRQPLQNTPQTTDAMKDLAQFLLQKKDMSPREAAMLQNFVNNTQTMMPEAEARHLQNLLRLCQQNVPLTVQQAAVQQNLPDLPRLWAFMQLCDMANIASKMNSKALKRAGRDVADFATAMRHAMSSENTTVQNQRSFQMMMPLYMGDNEASYPTYLNVYDETTRDEETGQDKKETWLRICVLTDHIGAAELIFRVYDETQLDMRFYFSRRDVAQEFSNIYVKQLKNSLQDTALNVGEVRVGSVGERMRSA